MRRPITRAAPSGRGCVLGGFAAFVDVPGHATRGGDAILPPANARQQPPPQCCESVVHVVVIGTGFVKSTSSTGIVTFVLLPEIVCVAHPRRKGAPVYACRYATTRKA